MSEKRGDFGLAHLRRMPLGVKQNETPDPVHVTLFSTYAVVLTAQHTTHLVQELGLGGGLARRIRPIGSVHTNRGFVGAFSAPCSNNDLIGLKDDKGRRRIGYANTAFRRSTLS